MDMREQTPKDQDAFISGARPSDGGQKWPGDFNRSPRMWDECGIEERVQRLRSMLIDLRFAFAGTRETCEQLSHHSHDALGHVVVPLDFRRGGVGTAFDSLA